MGRYVMFSVFGWLYLVLQLVCYGVGCYVLFKGFWSAGMLLFLAGLLFHVIGGAYWDVKHLHERFDVLEDVVDEYYDKVIARLDKLLDKLLKEVVEDE